jgi:hypothetical protein
MSISIATPSRSANAGNPGPIELPVISIEMEKSLTVSEIRVLISRRAALHCVFGNRRR